MNSCQGPCLKHCYAKNSLVLIFIGITAGFLITKFLEKDDERLR